MCKSWKFCDVQSIKIPELDQNQKSLKPWNNRVKITHFLGFRPKCVSLSLLVRKLLSPSNYVFLRLLDICWKNSFASLPDLLYHSFEFSLLLSRFWNKMLPCNLRLRSENHLALKVFMLKTTFLFASSGN